MLAQQAHRYSNYIPNTMSPNINKIRCSYNRHRYNHIFRNDNQVVKRYFKDKYSMIICLADLSEDFISQWDIVVKHVEETESYEIYEVCRNILNLNTIQLALLIDDNLLEYGFRTVKEDEVLRIVINKPIYEDNSYGI